MCGVEIDDVEEGFNDVQEGYKDQVSYGVLH